MVKKRQKLSESYEMYLKTIYELSRKDNTVQAKDVAWQLEVSKPSVTRALKKLGEQGYIHYAPYEAILLTAKGERIGKALLIRFTVLQSFFQGCLQLPQASANEMACVLEHAVPENILQRLVKLLEFMKGCSRGRIVWRESDQSFACQTEICQHENNAPFGFVPPSGDKVH